MWSLFFWLDGISRRLLLTIVDLFDRNGSGWWALGDRGRLETGQLSGKPTFHMWIAGGQLKTQSRPSIKNRPKADFNRRRIE